MFDIKCYNLAKFFMEDEPKEIQTPENIERLAQSIQNEIESELRYMKKKWREKQRAKEDGVVLP